MSRQDLLLWVFCLIDDEMKALNLPRLRTRGRQATALTDPEVITIELVGEFRGLDARAAAAALQTLPAETREIIVAHLWGGLTFEQIAAAVGSSAATCYRRYAAGLDVLRSQLGAVCHANTKS